MKVLRKSWEIHEKVMRKSWESHEKVIRKSWESHEINIRKSFTLFQLQTFAVMVVLDFSLDTSGRNRRHHDHSFTFQAKSHGKNWIKNVWMGEMFYEKGVLALTIKTLERHISRRCEWLNGINEPSLLTAHWWKLCNKLDTLIILIRIYCSRNLNIL